MTTPHPTEDLDAYTAAYSTAWMEDPAGLLEFFDPAGTYSHMAMGTTYTGRDEIQRFHRDQPAEC